jgi:hypothetical protein
VSFSAELPFLGEGDRNYQLWLMLRQHIPESGDCKVSIKATDHGPWLKADGRAMTPASGYLALRKVLLDLGSPFGVVGADPKLPDARDRALVIAGTSHTLGAAFGSDSLSEPDHTHQYTVPVINATLSFAAAGADFNVATVAGTGNTSGSSVGTGSGTNSPPSITLNLFVHI